MTLVVFVAAVLRSFTGFGLALVVVPALSLFVAPAQVVVISSALAFSISLLSVRSFRRQVTLAEMAPLLLTAGVGTAVGVTVLALISVQLFQLLVGLAVLLACAGIAVSAPGRVLHVPGLAWVAGLLSGLMNGALAIPGPPMILYALMTEAEPARSRALLMAFFMASSALALLTP